MKSILNASVCAALALMFASCSGLSDEAKEMVGDYYIPEVSPDAPLMELNGNGKCVIRAVKPGIISYEVPGRWNVERDSLILKLKPEKLSFEGDSTLIGEVPERIAQKISDYSGSSLTLQKGGVNYVYFRRGKIEK